MANNPFEILFAQGDIIPINMSGVTTAHKGDFLCWSGGAPIVAAIEADSALTAYGRASALGYLLQDHPQWTPQGSGYSATAAPVLVGGGLLRVSAVGNFSAGYICWQHLPGSGRVGQTGATGRDAVWTATAANVAVTGLLYVFTASGNGVAPVTGTALIPSALPNSGMGRIVHVYSAGNTGSALVQVWPGCLLGALAGQAVQR